MLDRLGPLGETTHMQGALFDKDVLIVVLAYNEEDSIGTVVNELRTKVPGAAVLVVDDGSADGTSDRSLAAGARVVRHPFNLGVAAAETTGLMFAQRNGYGAVVRVDGDGQHAPAFIPELLRALTSADLAIGVRTRGTAGYQATGLRFIGGAFLVWLVRALSGVRVTDVTSGFRGFGPRAVAFFSQHTPNDYPEPESIVMAARAHLSVAEVPVVMRPRETGQSSLTVGRSVFYMVKVTLALLLETLRPPYGSRQ